jgi:DNA-binding NtrC family response regulator
VTLPPLRARREDIPVLAQHFIRQSCRHNHLTARTIAPSALRLLIGGDWPGNVRQLENAIEHAVVMSGQATELLPEMFPADVRDPTRATLIPALSIPDEGINFNSIITQMERELIVQCLEKTGGNKRQAARLLNLSRTTLIDKLHRLGIRDSPAA